MCRVHHFPGHLLAIIYHQFYTGVFTSDEEPTSRLCNEDL